MLSVYKTNNGLEVVPYTSTPTSVTVKVNTQDEIVIYSLVYGASDVLKVLLMENAIAKQIDKPIRIVIPELPGTRLPNPRHGESSLLQVMQTIFRNLDVVSIENTNNKLVVSENVTVHHLCFEKIFKHYICQCVFLIPEENADRFEDSMIEGRYEYYIVKRGDDGQYTISEELSKCIDDSNPNKTYIVVSHNDIRETTEVSNMLELVGVHPDKIESYLTHPGTYMVKNLPRWHPYSTGSGLDSPIFSSEEIVNIVLERYASR